MKTTTHAQTRISRFFAFAMIALLIAGLAAGVNPGSASAKAAAAALALPAGDAEGDIDAFWNATLGDAGIAYYTPAVVGFSEGITTGGCGWVDPASYSSFYCPTDSTIYYSVPTIAGELDRFGDAGWDNIMAHEWGHHVQLLLGILANTSDVMTLELQATCLAGVYVQNAVGRDLIDATAVPVMLDMFAGDSSHGSRDALQGAFNNGFDAGLSGCGIVI